MNLTALYELKEQLETAAVSGCRLMKEDFRLKRAIEQMKPLAAAAPVFQKIEQTARLAVSSECGDPTGTLLDALALIDAVACTQGTVGVSGELQPLEGGEETDGLRLLSNISYSRMAPLVEALTGTGGGRYAVIVKAMEEEPELFCDCRLAGLLVGALGDSYRELASLAYRQLLKTGPGVLPLLKNGFDVAGKREMSLRLELIGKLAGRAETLLYRQAALEGDKQMKETAIPLLSLDQENVPFLFDMMKAEKGTVKNAVLKALSCMDMEDDSEYRKALKKKKAKEQAAILEESSHDRASDLTADLIEQELAAEQKQEKKRDLEERNALWRAAGGKHSRRLLNLIRTLYQENPEEIPEWFFYDSLCDNPCQELYEFTEEMFEIWDKREPEKKERSSGLLEAECAAKLITRPAAEVYEWFQSRPEEDTSGIFRALLGVRYASQSGQYVFSDWGHGKGEEKKMIPLLEPLDGRWYDWLLTKTTRSRIRRANIKLRARTAYDRTAWDWKGWTKLDTLLASLYCLEREGLAERYREYFGSLLQDGVGIERFHIDILSRCGYSDWDMAVDRILKNNKDRYLWGVRMLLDQIPLEGRALAECMKKSLSHGTATGQDRLLVWADQLMCGASVMELI